MRVLLDSQTVWWTLLQKEKLSRAALEALANPTNTCFISPINHWEMALKMSVGAYKIDSDFSTLWEQALARFSLLPIEPKHSAKLIDLPFHHRDPFDRMLIAQALSEGVPLVSSDRQLDTYGVQRIW